MSGTDTAVVATATRKVKVISTRGEKKEIDFNGTTWEELRKKLTQSGYDLKNIKAVEGSKRNTLEHDKAIVPEGDFNLFLFPLKVKSGAKAAKKAVKKAAPKKAAKKVAKKAVAKKAVKKAATKKATVKAKPAKAKKEAIAKVVQSVAEAKKPDVDPIQEYKDLSYGFSDVDKNKI